MTTTAGPDSKQRRHHGAGPAAGGAREIAPGKQTRTGELGGGLGGGEGADERGPAKRKERGQGHDDSGGGGDSQRAGDWDISAGLMAAMGLGELGGLDGADGTADHGASAAAAPAAPAVQLRARGSSPALAIQAKGGAIAGGASAGAAAAGPDLSATADRGVAGAAAPLPHLDTIQQAFGRHDVSGVRAQVGGEGATAAGALGAEAYATGDRIAFAQSPDLHTAAHEAAHVVQQAGGVQLKDGLGRPGDVYERHADAVADAVVAGKSAETLLDSFAAPASASATGATGATASSSPPTAQRKAVQLVAAVYKSATDLKAMSLATFDAYAHRQVDWATSATLGDDKELLRSLLGLARKNTGRILNACGAFSVNELLMCGAGHGAVDAELNAYARGVQRAANTIAIDVPADKASTAVLWGETMLQLYTELTDAIAARVISQNSSYQALATLAGSDDLRADFIKYYKAVHPLLDAKDGKELKSFLAFRNEGGPGKVSKYKAGLKEVRNYHRFTVPQLDTLHDNRAKGPGNPGKIWSYNISVILQTALDHNSAFHRDPYLDAVLDRFSYLTLIAEGKASLAEFSAELATFATFSKTGKVDEVMVAGHGSAKSMQLAGTSNDDQQKVTVDATTATPQQLTATTDFLKSIKAVLSDSEDARLVLKACLTGSNSISKDLVLDPDPIEAAKQIKKAIKDHPSLATRARAIMGNHKAQVRGANGSFSAPPMLDGSSLDIISVHDPKLTATKLEYVKDGLDPTGVLRATLESWAHDKGKTLTAIRARLAAKAGDTSWKQRLVYSLMKLINAAPDDAARIRMLEEVAGGIGHVSIRSDLMVAKLKNKLPAAFNQGFMDAVFTDMAGTADWKDAAQDHIPAVMYQVWIAKNAAKIPAFLAFLNTSTFTTQSAARFFDLAHLEPMIATLLPDVAGVPPRGSFLLALLYMTKRKAAAPAEAKTYITNVVGAGKQRFSSASKVDTILKGATKRSVLQSAGVLPQAGQPGAVANLAPTGAGDNELTIDSVTKKCRTQGAQPTNAYMLPAGTLVGTIPTGTDLHVIGRVQAPVRVPVPQQPAVQLPQQPAVQLPVVVPQQPALDAQPQQPAVQLPQQPALDAQPQQPVLPPAQNLALFAVEHTIGTDKTVFVVAADVQLV